MMLEKPVIERILKANGVSPTASDEEIRSVLVRARWHHDDVDTAITILRENIHTHRTRTDTLHKVFRSDDRLQPETITSLLGIEVDMPVVETAELRRSSTGYTSGQILTILIVSIAVAIVMVLGSMWSMEIGVFHNGQY